LAKRAANQKEQAYLVRRYAVARVAHREAQQGDFFFTPPPHSIVSVLQGGSDRHIAGIGEPCAVVIVPFSAIILIPSKLFVLYFRQRLWRNRLGYVELKPLHSHTPLTSARYSTVFSFWRLYRIG
jgi:hypothetical protein